MSRAEGFTSECFGGVPFFNGTILALAFGHCETTPSLNLYA